VAGFPPKSRRASRCRVAGLRKMPFFCRLEIGFLLRRKNLGRFLIGRAAIRKCVIGDWELVNGGDAVLRRLCSSDPTAATVAIT